MSKKPAFFQMYRNYETQFSMLSNEQIGVLMRALFAYVNRDEEPNCDDLTVRVLFSVFKDNIDREFGNYDKRCEQNRQNILRRYTTENERSQKEKEEEKEKEKEKEKEDEEEHSLSNPQGGLESGESEFQEILFSYHFLCQGLPKVSKLTEKRKKAIKKALPYLNEKGFEGLFEKAGHSDFLLGRTGVWKADFDWLLQPDNLTRVLEGRYDNAPEPVVCFPSPRRESWQEQRSSSYDINALEAVNHLDEYEVES